MNEKEFLGGGNRFIVTSKLENLEDTGSIMDKGMKTLAYFKHKHTWKPPPGPSPPWVLKAKTTDIRLETIDDTLLGEIHEIPPPLMKMRLIRKWEIYNAEKELKGIVREKPKFIGSDWVLENPEGKVIATIKGNRRKKDYKVLTNRNQIIARCYRHEKIGKTSYYVDILHYDIDTFLVLTYIIVLDQAKTGWTTVSFGPR